MTPFERLVDIMARLRSENGCPWDKEQTHATLRPYLIEEAYEVIEAIDKGDDESLREELGDLLLQVVFHAQLAAEASRFTIDDVATVVNEKLIRRHPHVFGDVEANTSDVVLGNWEKIKRAEKDNRRVSILGGLPQHLPALLKAYRVQEKVARVNFDWKDIGDVFEKVQEEFNELLEAYQNNRRRHMEEEFGDLLFSMVNLARHLKITPEDALRKTVGKFIVRFQYIESVMALKGERLDEATLERLDELWEEAKNLEERQ